MTQNPWGREIKEEARRSPWGRPITESRTNPWGRPQPETQQADQSADAEVSEGQREADRLVADLAEAYSRWAGAKEAEAADWAADIAKYHLDKIAARAGSEEDYLKMLREHAADINRRPPLTGRGGTAGKLRPTSVRRISEALQATEEQKG